MSATKVVKEYPPMLRIYEDGHIERLLGTVRSKDVVYSPQLNLSSRFYLPKSATSNEKLPLLVYFHGGAFCVETAFSPTYHDYLNKLVEEANVVVVSVDYRLAPECPLPAAYDDSWTALKWVASHFNGHGQEEWLNLHADLDRVYLAGDSAGGNIAHYIVKRYRKEKLKGINIAGLVLIHPFFWGKVPIGDEVKNLKLKKWIDDVWFLAYPSVSGLDDSVINPSFDSNLSTLGCTKVLVFVAGKDMLKDRGWEYYKRFKNCGWEGFVEVMDAGEEEHVFHLNKPTCDNAVAMLNKTAAFLNDQ